MSDDKKNKEKKDKHERPKLSLVDASDPKALAKIVSAVQSAFKETPSIVCTDPDEENAIKYRTGILSLDRALGIGGVLGGRIINTYGENGTGKTLLNMTIGGEVQRQGGIVAVLDAEGTFSPKFARACGLDPETIIYVRSTPEKIMAGEDFFEVLRLLVAQGVHYIIVDSGPALVPSQRFSQAFGEGQQASHARLMSDELQKVTGYLTASTRTVVGFINQVRSKPMVMFGPTSGSTGGKALEFYMSYCFEMKRAKDITAKVRRADGSTEEKVIGVQVKLAIEKNKTASKPVHPIEFDVYTEFATTTDGKEITPGVDIVKDMFEVGKACGVITLHGSQYRFGEWRGNGETDFCTMLRNTPAAVDGIRELVLSTTPAPEIRVVGESG